MSYILKDIHHVDSDKKKVEGGIWESREDERFRLRRRVKTRKNQRRQVLLRELHLTWLESRTFGQCPEKTGRNQSIKCL